jgi:hypothetical protein
MAVKAKHVCIHGKQYAKAGEGVEQAGGGTEHLREGGHGTDNWEVSTT